VLLVSGILGFGFGMLRFPTWQVAVETAQVVAGLVKYPAGNPFYVYHTKLWTVLHQMCALLLLSGVSEITLSRLVSGLVGMVSFQALSLFVYALSADAALAIGSMIVIFLSNVTDRGAVYPVLLMNTSHTYGALGLSTIVLVVALFGAGCYRTAGFLLGLSPAVHPSLGAWLWLTTALCFVWDFRNLRDELRPASKYFLAGCAVTAASLLVQLLFIYDVPQADAAASARYFSAFVAFWDPHRQPLPLITGASVLNVGALALAATWLVAFRDGLPRPAIFVLRFVLVCAGLSLAFVCVSWIPPDRLPAVLLILMPSRLLNFNVMVFAALLVGLLGAYRGRFGSEWLTAGLLGGLLVASRSKLWKLLPLPDSLAWFDPMLILASASIGVVCVAAFTSNQRGTGRVTNMFRIAALGALPVAVPLIWLFSPPRPVDFRNQSNDAFFATIAAEPNGLLLTGGSLHLIQLTTRRPVLLDGGGLDTLPYALEAAPEMQRILRDVYDIDLLNPPADAKGTGSVPDDVNKVTWKRYSREKWQQIGRTWNVTQVVTHRDWSLDLPLAAENDWLRLYQIPAVAYYATH
jgi:hypothetical protein